jgi:hypothetical protein
MIYEIIGLAAVGVIFTQSEPTIRLKDFILKSHQGIFRRLLECTMCSTWHIYFWFILISQCRIDILGASICAVLAELIANKLTSGGL